MNKTNPKLLMDTHSRRHTYLRVSVTDKCNLRCSYCMPPDGVTFLSHEDVLRNEEFIRLMDVFIQLGIEKVRFTGGEPFVRKGFMDILRSISERHPHVSQCLTTNGVLLEPYLSELNKLGVHRLNISLDTLNPRRFKELTGLDKLTDVIKNIDYAINSGFEVVKVNVVLMKETLNELESFISHFSQRPCVLRFIEMMPVTTPSTHLSFVSSQELIERFENLGTLVRKETSDSRVAMMYDFHNTRNEQVKLGIIPPMTHKFCNRCNRLRLTSEGMLKTCLYTPSDTNLKGLMRSGGSDEDLFALIKKDVLAKQPEHHLSTLSQDGGCQALRSKGGMSKVGG